MGLQNEKEYMGRSKEVGKKNPETNYDNPGKKCWAYNDHLNLSFLYFIRNIKIIRNFQET